MARGQSQTRREVGEPAEPAPPRPPAPPQLIYDPNQPGGDSGVVGGAVGAAGGALSGGGPVGAFLGAVGSVVSGAFGKEPREFRGSKLVADSATGKVTVAKKTNISGRQQKLAETEARNLELLQITFDTGLVQAGISSWYADFATQLAAFRNELDTADRGGHVPTPGVPGDRGENPPPVEVPVPGVPGLPDVPGGIGGPGGFDERGGPVGSTALNTPIDLRGFMPIPYMPFSGVPLPRGGGGGMRRRRRTKAKSTKRRARRANGSKRKLKFGSAAYRRKYLGHK